MNTTVELHKRRLVLRTPYELKDTCGALPGALWDKGSLVWTVPATLATAARVHNVLHPHGYTPSDEVSAILDAARAAADARKWRLADELPEFESGSEYAPWLHQARAFHFARAQQGVLLAPMVMGSGKSRIIVDLCRDWQATRVLIVCPKNVLRVWPREFRRHGFDGEDAYAVHDGYPYKRNGGRKLTASLTERAEHIDDILRYHYGEPTVIVLNYESVWREPMRSMLLEHDWHVGVLDEAHRAGAPGGKSSTFLARLRDKCDRRIGATGTLDPMRAYAVCRFVEPGLFGTNYAKFKARYGKPKVKYTTHDVDADGELVEVPVYLTTPQGEPIIDGIKPEVEKEFADKLASISFECGDDVLDLPEPVDTQRVVELSPKASRIYGQLERELVAEVAVADSDEAALIVVSNVLSKLLRLQQITSGDVPVELGVETRVEHIDDGKEEMLADVLADIPASQPVVVFVRFKPDLDAVRRVADKLGRKYGELSGRRKDALDDEACLTEGVELAGVQIQSGGVGIDFTRARYAVYYSVGFDRVDYVQSRYRVRRPGASKTRPVEFLHLVAEGTIDEYVYEALERKTEIAAHVVALMRARMAAEVAA